MSAILTVYTINPFLLADSSKPDHFFNGCQAILLPLCVNRHLPHVDVAPLSRLEAFQGYTISFQTVLLPLQF